MTVRTTYGRRAATACAVAISAAIALSGCAAGQQAQTAHQYSVVDGATGDIGNINLRNAGVASPASITGYAAGSDVALVVSIVNNGNTPDVLTSVTTTSATGTLVQRSVAPTPTATPSESPSPTESASPSTSGSASGSASNTSSASPSPTEAAAPVSVPIDLPANTLVRFGDTGQPVIMLNAIKSALIPGQTVSVTFTFQNAGAITLALPVKLISDSTGGETVDVEPSTEG